MNWFGRFDQQISESGTDADTAFMFRIRANAAQYAEETGDPEFSVMQNDLESELQELRLQIVREAEAESATRLAKLRERRETLSAAHSRGDLDADGYSAAMEVLEPEISRLDPTAKSRPMPDPVKAHWRHGTRVEQGLTPKIQDREFYRLLAKVLLSQGSVPAPAKGDAA